MVKMSYSALSLTSIKKITMQEESSWAANFTEGLTGTKSSLNPTTNIIAIAPKKNLKLPNPFSGIQIKIANITPRKIAMPPILGVSPV